MQQFNSQNIVSNGRKIRTAAGSAAVALIQTAKLNGGGPRAWLADVRGRIADHNSQRLDCLGIGKAVAQ